jgi:hypothetical protein
MDIKRVAFETRPVKSTRPAVSAQTVSTQPQPAKTSVPPRQPAVAGGKINREEIAAIVDRFLAGRRPDEMPPQAPEPEAGSMYAGSRQSISDTGVNGRSETKATTSAANRSANGSRAVDFVSEDDVRRAIQKGEKIYINGRTIITPAARDIGEPAEVFAKV